MINFLDWLTVYMICLCFLVDKKEHQAGHDPAQELKDSGFHDVGRM